MVVTVIDEMDGLDTFIKSSLDSFLSISFAPKMMQQLPDDSHVIGLKYIAFDETLGPNILSESNNDVSYKPLSPLAIMGIFAGLCLVFLGIPGMYLSMRNKLRRKRSKTQSKGSFQGEDDDAIRLPRSPQSTEVQDGHEVVRLSAINDYKQRRPQRTKLDAEENNSEESHNGGVAFLGIGLIIE